MTKNKTEYYTTLFEFTTVKNKRVEIKRTKNWEINITQTAKSLGKRWRLGRSQKIVKVYEKLAGRKLVRQTDRGLLQTFLDLTLALRVMSQMDLVLSYHIFELSAQQLRLNSSNVRAKLEPLKQKLATPEYDRIFDNWANLNAPFAFYYFVIDNVVKCGAVGLKGSKNSESLNARLSGHRTTHARLKLINVIYFKDSETVTVFENLIKFVLEDYSVGIEQYEWPGENSEEIINEIILKQFDEMNRLNDDAGWLCDPELINTYNETMRIRLRLINLISSIVI